MRGSRGKAGSGGSGLTGFSAGFSAPFLDFLPPRLALLRPISSSASTSFFLNTCAHMACHVTAGLVHKHPMNDMHNFHWGRI